MNHLTYWISEEDEGMYHAINEFPQSTGEVQLGSTAMIFILKMRLMW